MIYAELGRTAELERWRASLLASDPDFSAERLLWRTGDFLLPLAAAERALFFDSVTKAALPTRSEVIKSFLSLLSHGRSSRRTTCRKPGPCAPRT